MRDAVLLAVAIVAALVCTPLAARVARRLGAVDRPGPLKPQMTPVPYLGGVAVLAAIAVPVAVTHAALLLPLALLTALGLADDLFDSSPRVRVVAEAEISIVAGVVEPAPGRLGVLVTAALVLGLVNAVNLLDGLDGLAGGVAAASALGFALLGTDVRPFALALVGSLTGFLWYNRPPARIYLGDAGAYLIGGALALAAAAALRETRGVATWAAVPLLVALPVFDTSVAIIRRRRAGRSIASGDRSHVYDQLVVRGRPRPTVVVELVIAQAALTAIGVVAFHLSAPWAVTLAGVVVVLLAAVATLAGFVSAPTEVR